MKGFASSRQLKDGKQMENIKFEKIKQTRNTTRSVAVIMMMLNK